MNRIVSKILMILLGVLLCIGVQISLRVLRNYPNYSKHFGAIRREGMTESDIVILKKIHEAFARDDHKTVNEILQIKPDEIELVVRACPVYPDGFVPVARIFIKNISNRPVVILEPTVTRLTSPSYSNLGRLRDDFSVLWSNAGRPNWCHTLEPHQVFALPITDLAVEGTGLHEVNFTLNTPLYEEVSEDHMKARFLKVSEKTVEFKIEEEAEQN